MRKGKFIMVDGIDGSGKSTIINTWCELLENSGHKIFSLKNFWLENGRHPKPEEIPEDVFAVISAEPTNVWVGAAIREDMIQKGSSYTPHSIAAAFALDRLVLYTRVLVPILERGVHVIQDRGVSTSLCYQAVELEEYGLTRDNIADLEGNTFALKHAPDILLLMDIEPEICMERLAGRHEKDDNAIFERIEFQKKIHDCFHSEEFQNFFRPNGTQVHTFKADQELGIIKEQLCDLLNSYLSINI